MALPYGLSCWRDREAGSCAVYWSPIRGAMTTRAKLENKAYEPREWEDPACPVCGSREHSLFERFGDRGQYTYVLCASCRLVYLAPRPKYDDGFVHEAYEFYAEDSDRLVKSDAFLEATLPKLSLELDELARYDRSRAALLDVGCALGNFLYAAKPRYQAVYGLDVSSRMAAFIETTIVANVFRQRFEDLETPIRFSAIRMSHVIEHIPDPNRWLQKAKGLLKEDGILVIDVPNAFALDTRFKLALKRAGLRKGTWDPSWTPDHLYEPTVPGMLRLFARNRYEVLDCYSHGTGDPIASSAWAAVYHRRWVQGSKMRFYVRPANPAA